MSSWDDISRLMEENSDRMRLAGADRRNLKRVPTLRAARACHVKRVRRDAALSQSTTFAGGDAEYVARVAEHFRPPQDLADMRLWWSFFMAHRGVPRVLYVILAHFRFSEVRLAFMGHLIRSRSTFTLDEVLAAACVARASYAQKSARAGP
jgi:hypothetical protein